jgi:hypothetical protein
MKIFQWQSGNGGFALRREFSFSETPRAILCVGGNSGSVIVGLKKHYEVIDLQTFNSIKLLDFEKEHRLVVFEVSSRPVLLSLSHSCTSSDPCDLLKKQTSLHSLNWDTRSCRGCIGRDRCLR